MVSEQLSRGRLLLIFQISIILFHPPNRFMQLSFSIVGSCFLVQPLDLKFVGCSRWMLLLLVVLDSCCCCCGWLSVAAIVGGGCLVALITVVSGCGGGCRWCCKSNLKLDATRDPDLTHNPAW